MSAPPFLPRSAVALAVHVDHRGAVRRQALRERLLTVLRTVDPQTTLDDGAPTSALLEGIDGMLAGAAPDRVWLALAVISGQLPRQADVEQAIRTTRLDGALGMLSGLLVRPRRGWPVARGAWPKVTVIREQVLVDAHHTARTGLATGIQRVARQTAQRWARDHQVTLVGWTRDFHALRELSDTERAQALYGGALIPGAPELAAFAGTTDANVPGERDGVLVPWHCTYVLPELLTEPARAQALLAMLEFSGTAGSMIGFDCVPLTSAETIVDGMGAGFSMMLAAIARGRRIATISESAAVEYRGWRAMLSGAGMTGPDIRAISLPVEAVEPSADALVEAHRLLSSGPLPMVLCVGSHEPRKNHLAVLHAAELLWREGLQFSLVFVGGNAWNSERFTDRLEELQEQGRPVESVRALSDELLWAAYRIARCVVFPSLNEGFGLPVAEALSSGTPVLTSGFGRMAEIAAEGGAELVDPRDDHAIRDALRRLIADDARHAELAAQARGRSVRTWEHYAAQTWDYLIAASSDSGEA